MARADEHKGQGQAGGVHQQVARRARCGAGRRRQYEDGAEHASQAGAPAAGEGRPQKRPGPAPPRALDAWRREAGDLRNWCPGQSGLRRGARPDLGQPGLQRLPDAAGGRPRRTNTAVKPAMNGEAARTPPRPRPDEASVPPDGREVARDQGQHAGRGEREQARREGQDEARRSLEALEVGVEPALEPHVARGAAQGARQRVPSGCPAPSDHGGRGAAGQDGRRDEPRGPAEAVARR